MIIFVTGATSGFGEAIARRFIREGHQVIAAGRRLERLEELQEELGQALHIVRLDVRNRAAIQQAIEALPAELRQIDVLVNNAGLALGLEPAHKANADDWETMIDTNAKGLVNMTRALLPAMVERNVGHVINIGSTAANWPYAGGNVRRHQGVRQTVQPGPARRSARHAHPRDRYRAGPGGRHRILQRALQRR